MPGMESNAAELSGEDQVTATLQDENSQRLEETTAMDEDGAIYEIHEEKGIVAEGTPSQNAMFLAKTSGQSKVVNFNTKGSAVTSFTYGGGSGYTNGAYGADAAYLGMTDDGKVRFYAVRSDRNGKCFRSSGCGVCGGFGSCKLLCGIRWKTDPLYFTRFK